HISPPVLLPNPQSPSEDPCDLRPKSPRRRPAPPSSRSASSHRLVALLAGDPAPLRRRRASGAAALPWSHCPAPPPSGHGAGCSRSLLVDPPANTATNHLVHGHLLASHGCCSSAPPHLSNPLLLPLHAVHLLLFGVRGNAAGSLLVLNELVVSYNFLWYYISFPSSSW
uniref:Uncharacterized protein n=1 Tax=Oryza barthii TaxID=65489 RepID=A0A0D3EV21_9ORYZ